MFIDGLGDDRVEAAARTEEGRNGVVYPVLPDPAQDRNLTLPPCVNCSKVEDHGHPCCQMGRVVDVGDEVLGVDDEDNVVQAELCHLLQVAVSRLSYTVNGWPTWRPENMGAGTANNWIQELRFEIVAIVSPRRLRVKTKNALNMGTGYTVTNPEWPLAAPEELRPDGMSDEDWDVTKYAYLIPQSKRHVLPPGSMVTFGWPSVLYKKLRPWVTKIIPGSSVAESDVEFEVELSHTVSYAMTPYDAAYPPSDGKYYGSFWYFSVAPEPWKNFQKFETMWVTRRRVTLTKAELEGTAGVVSLRNSDGDPCRVLFPSMGTNVMVVSYNREGGAPVTMTDAEVTNALTVDDDGVGWDTKLDLSAIPDYDDIVDVSIAYMPEAVAGDAPVIAMQGSCSNSQKDHTGSYIHTSAFTDPGFGSETHRCMEVNCSKFAEGAYRTTCWNPKATKFVRGFDADGKFPVANPRDSNWLMRMWSDVSMVREQGLEGVNSARNFWLRRVGVPSLQEVIGGFIDMVPQGKFPRREPMFPARMGQRREFENDDGDADHEIINGLFFARTHRGNQDDGYTDLGFEGATRAMVDDWDSREDRRGESATDTERDYPRNEPPALHVYEYAGGVSGTKNGLRVSGYECTPYITGVSRDAVNAEAMAVIGELL